MEVRCYLDNYMNTNSHSEISVCDAESEKDKVIIEINGEIAKVNGSDLIRAIHYCLNM